MKLLNRKKAWMELACPAILNLSPNILQLVYKACTNRMKLSAECTVNWPDDKSFKEQMQEIPADELASAARIVWAAGHWHPGSKDLLHPLSAGGAYYKFPTYVDQLLREAVLGWEGSQSTYRIDNRMSLEIHEGFLRVDVWADKSFSWHEIALGSINNVEAATQIINNCKHHDPVDDIINQLMQLRPTKGAVAPFFDLTRFYE
ncbi:MAG: hypothetical protein Q8O87_02480 [bacterium]|nr:hypothetical protein [bacterium]